MDLQEIKQYFGEKNILFEKNKIIESKLNEKEKEILFSIGLPNYNGYAGDYIMIPKLEMIEGRYIQFSTRRGDEKEYFRYIDFKTKNIVFKFYSKEYNYLNKDLESYLRYIYTDQKFFDDFVVSDFFGDYDDPRNREKYAKELERQFLAINDDVKKGSWSALIEEMGYGLV